METIRLGLALTAKSTHCVRDPANSPDKLGHRQRSLRVPLASTAEFENRQFGVRICQIAPPAGTPSPAPRLCIIDTGMQTHRRNFHQANVLQVQFKANLQNVTAQTLIKVGF